MTVTIRIYPNIFLDRFEAWLLEARAAWRRHVCALFGHPPNWTGRALCLYCDWIDPRLIEAITIESFVERGRWWKEHAERCERDLYRVPLMFPDRALMPRKPAIFIEDV